MKRMTRFDVGLQDHHVRCWAMALDSEPTESMVSEFIKTQTILIPTRAQLAGFVESARFAFDWQHSRTENVR